MFVLRFESPYVGNPYYITGNGIYHAVASRLTDAQRASISVSHGVFFNVASVEVGGKRRTARDSEGHLISTQAGASPISKIWTYEDFFLLRTQRLETLNLHGPWGEMFYEESLPVRPLRFDNSDQHRLRRPEEGGDEAIVWEYLNFYTHGCDDLDPNLFDGISLGGKRNKGFGATSLADSAEVRVDELDFLSLERSGNVDALLITPICLKSQFPGTEPCAFPSFAMQPKMYRTRSEFIKHGDQRYGLELIDHGQRFDLAPVVVARRNLVELAKEGIKRIGTHSKYGYGEFKLTAGAGRGFVDPSVRKRSRTSTNDAIKDRARRDEN